MHERSRQEDDVESYSGIRLCCQRCESDFAQFRAHRINDGFVIMLPKNR